MKSTQYHIVGIVPKSNKKNQRQMYTTKTHIHDRSLSKLGTGTSIKMAVWH